MLPYVEKKYHPNFFAQTTKADRAPASAQNLLVRGTTVQSIWWLLQTHLSTHHFAEWSPSLRTTPAKNKTYAIKT
jgi:1,2-phenylacetyl-CoA epoxidase PaaB subunit